MTRREQYGLTFYKIKDPKSGKIYPICIREEVHQYSELQFIGHLNSDEIKYLITEIENSEDGIPYDQYPSSDSYEDIEIELIHPNVTINEILVLPMIDFKELLNGWRLFLEQ